MFNHKPSQSSQLTTAFPLLTTPNSQLTTVFSTHHSQLPTSQANGSKGFHQLG